MFQDIYRLMSFCVHLINNMPSSLLHGKTSFSCLYLDNTMFPLVPRVFGCICFILDLTLCLNRLPPCATECVFVGYSGLKRGISALMYKKYVFANVTFFESAPYVTFSASTE